MKDLPWKHSLGLYPSMRPIICISFFLLCISIQFILKACTNLIFKDSGMFQMMLYILQIVRHTIGTNGSNICLRPAITDCFNMLLCLRFFLAHSFWKFPHKHKHQLTIKNAFKYFLIL